MSIYCTTFKLQCGSITKRSTHLAPFNCCDHAVLASPRRSDIWSLSTVKYLLPRISILYILLHQFAVLCCIFMAIWISMWSVISTLHDWFIWFYFAWFCFCFKCKEKLKKYQMGWASTYTHILIWIYDISFLWYVFCCCSITLWGAFCSMLFTTKLRLKLECYGP